MTNKVISTFYSDDRIFTAEVMKDLTGDYGISFYISEKPNGILWFDSNHNLKYIEGIAEHYVRGETV